MQSRQPGDEGLKEGPAQRTRQGVTRSEHFTVVQVAYVRKNLLFFLYLSDFQISKQKWCSLNSYDYVTSLISIPTRLWMPLQTVVKMLYHSMASTGQCGDTVV